MLAAQITGWHNKPLHDVPLASAELTVRRTASETPIALKAADKTFCSLVFSTLSTGKKQS